jgi:hypothetical protein
MRGFPKTLLCAITAICLAPCAAIAAPFPKLKAQAVDPLVNVFQDSTINGTSAGQADCARGEHATFQVVVTSSPVQIRDLKCDVTTFTLANGTAQLPANNVRFVGYVGSSFSAKPAAHDQLRKAPAMFPDPLLEQKYIDVHAGDNQPIWISVKIPTDTQPGDYRATSVITGKIFGIDTTTTLPLNIKVYPATINHTRLNVTLWFQMWHRGDQPMPEKFSDEWWNIMRTYVAAMIDHRQNWARVETLWLMKFTRSASGELQFDFSNFDKWVQILLDGGIEHIEGLQYAWRGGEWKEPYVVEIHDENDKTSSGTRVKVDSPEAEAFFSKFFPALHDHLKEKGWLDKYVQHVGDEPVKENAASYRVAAGLLKKYAPGIPIMEACLDHNLVGAIDIWVPIMQTLGKDFAFFQERMKAGEKVWMYTCVQPQGEYANRFVELPLIKTRLLHWINYRYGIPGYLHWGFNFWRAQPWDNVASGSLPGGDSHIVYPAKNGYGIVESIRYEAMRDGIEDHELLSQLGEKDKDAAMKLATRHILNWNKYNTDIEAFRATRRELLEELSN